MNKMKPIFFNTEMVRALLDGRKTVTRRVIKFPEGQTGHLPPSGARDYIYYPGGIKRPPYQPGDILYVRETWFYESHMEDLTEDEPDLPSGTYSHRYVYKASYPDYPVSVGIGGNGWHPSIHMPKEAARIFLKVTDVRVERLWDITWQECIKEGIPKSSLAEMDEEFIIGQFQFHDLWNSTIKKSDLDRYGWEANPWVWVIEFEKVDKPADKK